MDFCRKLAAANGAFESARSDPIHRVRKPQALVVTRSPDRVIAQAMDRALFEDIRRLEMTLALDQLANVMVHAEPGWFSDRSWEFWRGRLSLATGVTVPEEAPRRALYAAEQVFARQSDTLV